MGQSVSFGERAGPMGLPALCDPSRTFFLADEFTRRFIPEAFSACPAAIVPRGEACKTLAVLDGVYAALLDAGAGRDWTLVAVGGGSVSDLGGFAAATWNRGMDLGLAPTTLLSMVDASLGGKNGVDYRGFKNLVGTVHLPRFTLMDMATLESLDARELASGLAEIIKHAVIDGPVHMELVESALGPNGRLSPAVLKQLVQASVELKLRITEADPLDHGERLKLNLGHSFGHALEAATGLPHGLCVAAGIMTAFRFALARPAQDRLSHTQRDADRTAALLKSAGLPLGITELCSLAGPERGGQAAVRSAAARAMLSDKKRRGDQLRAVLPLGIGSVSVEPVPVGALASFIEEAP
ncbi:MAG: 3-dehydroquinate synthase [Spirochaetales bacterium]|nr:3-dehydroquinate synthase [Spirochaetales bacterium]